MCLSWRVVFIAGKAAAVLVQEEEEEEEEEYLEDESEGEGEECYETAYVVVGEDGDFEFLDASALLTRESPGQEDTIVIEQQAPTHQRGAKRKPRENMALVLQEDEADESQTVQYIYAEGVNENNEIIIGEVPKYECDQCDRTFKRLDSLYKHNSVHTGRTACPVCGAVFSRIAHLTRHMRIKHPECPTLHRPQGRKPSRLAPPPV